MQKIAIILTMLFFSANASAQTGSITGKITDTSGKNVISLATVTVFKAKDTSIITYRLSSPEGVFKVPNLPLDIPLRFLVTFAGYDAYRKDFMLTAANPTLSFDSVKLFTTSKQLDEVIVVAERPPVMIKKDTIEFNASAFKTLPNALVEDLLKKLPGVQVDKDGNITVGGKPVNRILVDGKSFFGDDPKMATKNLPANVIDKIQVADDKEEQQRNGDDNPNNVGKVINITLKKGVKKGWFGKLYAGGGTELFEAGGIANIYRDTFQVSVLGYANNLNRPGFSYSELMQAGGFDRSRSNSNSNSTSIWNNNGGSSISLNGVNFGGSQNYGGIATSKGAGFNLNHSPNKKQSLFLQYFYGMVNIERENWNDNKIYNGDTIINTIGRVGGPVETNAHNIGFGARLKPDSVTNILFNVNYTIGLSEEDKLININSSNNKLGQLSIGNINQLNLGENYYYRHNLFITRLSKTKAGRRLNIFHGTDVSNRYNDLLTESLTKFTYPSAYDSGLYQLRKEKIPRTDVYTGFNYSEPLSKLITFRIGGRHEYGKTLNGISTLNRSNTFEYDSLNNNLSSQFTRESNRFSFSPAGFEFKFKGLTITPSIRVLAQSVTNNLQSLPQPLVQKQTDWLPGLSIGYKTLNFYYDRNVALPSYTFLLPVGDNTNPYLIIKGNPNLLPAIRDQFSINYFYNDTKKNFTASLYGNGSFTQKDIIQSTTMTDRGVQTNVPVNVDGSKSFYINFNLFKQYKNNQKFIFSWNTGGNYNYNQTKMLYNNEESWQTGLNFNNWFGINLNWNDKVEWNTSYSLGLNKTTYTNNNFKTLDIRYQYWDNELVVRPVKHVILETQCTYSTNNSIPVGLPQESIRWNAAINFTMLRNEVGVLKLSVNDILNRNNSVYAYTNRNVVTTYSTNILRRYFMATFTYNVRAAGVKKKVGGKERLFFF